MLVQTPSQTVGPFFHFGLTTIATNILVNEQTRGQRIQVWGQVLDGDGAALPDALIEIWQADAGGYYNHPADPNSLKADQHFTGFGRSDTVTQQRFMFKTLKPGRVRWDDHTRQAPHINLRLFARGLLIHAYTRLYFSDEAEANQTDPILNLIAPDRRPTLIAQRQTVEDLPTYQFNIRLQGDRETVFFDV